MLYRPLGRSGLKVSVIGLGLNNLGDRIDDNAAKVIDEAAKWGLDHPRDQINVTGFASSIGSRRSNALLSDLRASRPQRSPLPVVGRLAQRHRDRTR
jgi:aryl-alcohol dehydrogenase-like predicted oxidoreductase